MFGESHDGLALRFTSLAERFLSYRCSSKKRTTYLFKLLALLSSIASNFSLELYLQLQNVIVESADVASKILTGSRLQSRTHFLPLDKMDAKPISDQVLRVAQSLVSNKNQVQRALDLVEYDNKFKPAMVHIFGNALICSDMNVAKKVAFHQNVRCLCITLDGDKVSPR